MIFSRFKKTAPLAVSSILGCLGFIVLAIWGWDLPIATALSFLLISVLLLAAVILTALAAVALIKWLQCRHRSE